jgi:hypothetical protein
VIKGLQHVFEKWVQHCRSASLAKGGTLKKRLAPHLHKVLTWSNKVNPQTLQKALICNKSFSHSEHFKTVTLGKGVINGQKSADFCILSNEMTVMHLDLSLCLYSSP